jgi:predicted NBD/HSP70 family sugar kinase
VVAAVDWGGTWIRVAAVDGERIVRRGRCRRPAAIEEQYAAVADLVRSVAEAPRAVGVGVAGVVQGEEVMTAINLGITSPTGVVAGLRRLIREPLFLLNDVQATALGLAGRWPDDLTAVITLGTGVGGAVIDRGRLLPGNGAAGDFGHIVARIDGPACDCGGIGCLETLVSGRKLAEAAERLSASNDWLAAQRRSGRALHAGDLQAAAAGGDPEATRLLRDAAHAFAAALRTLVATLDPARIVLTGALLAGDALFGQVVRHRWRQLRPHWNRTELVHVADNEDAALMGVARFAERALLEP